MSNIKRFLSGSTFEQEIGYARAVCDGHYIFVSGTTGFDYNTMSISPELTEQTHQCLLNISQALNHFGADLTHVVRVTYMLAEASTFETCWPVLREAFAQHPPAATMIECQLADERMKIEIEVTAKAP